MFAETYVVGDDGFFFADVAASKMAVTKSHWKSPAEDDTIPMFVDEEKNYVAQIVAAFQALEKTPNARYCRRFIEGYYGDWQLEAKAWEIIKITENIHLNGFKTTILDCNLLEITEQTKDWTFAHRINILCDVLEMSKNFAISLMKDEKMMIAVGAPHNFSKWITKNREANAKKNQWAKEGRAREREHQSKVTPMTDPIFPNRDETTLGANNDPLVHGKIVKLASASHIRQESADSLLCQATPVAKPSPYLKTRAEKNTVRAIASPKAIEIPSVGSTSVDVFIKALVAHDTDVDSEADLFESSEDDTYESDTSLFGLFEEVDLNTIPHSA